MMNICRPNCAKKSKKGGKMESEKIIQMFAEKGIHMSHGKFKTEKHVYEIVRNSKRDDVKMSFIDNKDKKTGEIKFPVIIRFYTDLRAKIFDEVFKSKANDDHSFEKESSYKLICNECRTFLPLFQVMFRRKSGAIFYKKLCEKCLKGIP